MKIIGYDFDGVFINIEDEKAALFGKIVEQYWQAAPGPAADIWLMNLGTSRKRKFEIVYRNRFQAELPQDDYRQIEHEYSQRLMADYYPRARLVPETADAVSELNGEFDLSFLSSGIPHEEVNGLMAHFGLDRFFDRIFGTNDTLASKADHFKLITHGQVPAPGLFIGDGMEDMRVARQFGFTAIGLPTNHPASALREAGADVVCEPGNVQDEIRRRLRIGVGL